jgi:hypothetical protein
MRKRTDKRRRIADRAPDVAPDVADAAPDAGADVDAPAAPKLVDPRGTRRRRAPAHPERVVDAAPAEDEGDDDDEGEDEGDAEELEPDEPAPRATDHPQILIPGRATHFRAYRLLGRGEAQRLSHPGDTPGVAYSEWPVDDFSIATLLARWGQGPMRVQWVRKVKGGPTAVVGSFIEFMLYDVPAGAPFGAPPAHVPPRIEPGAPPPAPGARTPASEGAALASGAPPPPAPWAVPGALQSHGAAFAHGAPPPGYPVPYAPQGAPPGYPGGPPPGPYGGAYGPGYTPGYAPGYVPFHAPATGGVLAEAHSYFERFAGFFLGSWHHMNQQARAEIDARAERDRQAHERELAAQAQRHESAMEVLRMQLGSRKPASLTREDIRAVIAEELAEAQRRVEEEDDDQEDEAEGAGASGGAPTPREPETKQEAILRGVTEAANAVGNALGHTATIVTGAGKLAENLKDAAPAVRKFVGGGDEHASG